MVNYQRNTGNKAVALTPSGRWATVWGKASVEAAREAVIERCEEQGDKGDCLLYAVNDDVVFDDEQ